MEQLFVMIKVSVMLFVTSGEYSGVSHAEVVQTFQNQTQCERAVAAMGTAKLGELFVCIQARVRDNH